MSDQLPEESSSSEQAREIMSKFDCSEEVDCLI